MPLNPRGLKPHWWPLIGQPLCCPAPAMCLAISLLVSLHLLSALMPPLLQSFSHKSQILQFENQAANVQRDREVGVNFGLPAGAPLTENLRHTHTIADH